MAQTNASTFVKNIVLVHGAFVDGSTWRGVYDLLKQDGYNVAVVQNPTLSLEGDAASTRRVIGAQDGPVVLVGHSYGGAVITEAGRGWREGWQSIVGQPRRRDSDVPEHEDDSRLRLWVHAATHGEAGSETGVGLEKAVRRHAWFHHKPGSSRVSENGPLQAMLTKLRSGLHPGVSGSST